MALTFLDIMRELEFHSVVYEEWLPERDARDLHLMLCMFQVRPYVSVYKAWGGRFDKAHDVRYGRQMGCYIDFVNCKGAADKVVALIASGASPVQNPAYPPAPGEVLVCVVDNGSFSSAGVAFDQMEFERMQPRPNDRRDRVWFTLDREKALELAPDLPNWERRSEMR